MAQIIASIDEGSVNELFIKLYNAWPSMPVQPIVVSQSVGSGSVSAGLTFAIDSQASTQHLPPAARPIDLRTSSGTPPIAYSGLGWRVHSNVQATLRVGGVSLPFGLSFDTDAVLSGGAQVSAPHVGSSFQAQLQLTVGDFALSFASNRAAVVNAAKNAASQVDTHPFLPGTQHLPQSVIDAIGDAAGLLFDQSAPRAADAVKQLIRSRLGALQLTLTSSIPDHYTIQIPGTTQSVALQLQNLQLAVGGERVTLTVTFA